MQSIKTFETSRSTRQAIGPGIPLTYVGKPVKARETRQFVQISHLPAYSSCGRPYPPCTLAAWQLGRFSPVLVVNISPILVCGRARTANVGSFSKRRLQSVFEWTVEGGVCVLGANAMQFIKGFATNALGK